MTTAILVSASSQPLPVPVKKRRVLLVDTSVANSDLRADSMRKLGIEVDCAADINEARSWWRADLYNLVLLNVEDGLGQRDKFCEDIRGATPPQQLAFLVGKPDYLADSPSLTEMPIIRKEVDPGDWSDIRAALSAKMLGGVEQRWGILEASQRISAVRSLFHARSRATRERPAPPRDIETRHARGVVSETSTLDELLLKEMQ